MKTKKYKTIYIIILLFLTTSSYAQSLTMGDVINNVHIVNTEVYHLEQQTKLWNARLKAAQVLTQCKKQNIDCENTYKPDKTLLIKKVPVDATNNNNQQTKIIYKQKQIVPKIIGIYSKSVLLSSKNPEYIYRDYFNVGAITLDGWKILKINIDSIDFLHQKSGVKKSSLLFWSQ